ncbi:hypothetical protein H6776_02840 [Candidatus Nomurabacteria bacterium]|nr:hypothetical protein [Candidatus Nomurabacteria bacterium]
MKKFLKNLFCKKKAPVLWAEKADFFETFEHLCDRKIQASAGKCEIEICTKSPEYTQKKLEASPYLIGLQEVGWSISFYRKEQILVVQIYFGPNKKEKCARLSSHLTVSYRKQA